jgi:hypothetical protein
MAAESTTTRDAEVRGIFCSAVELAASDGSGGFGTKIERRDAEAQREERGGEIPDVAKPEVNLHTNN